MLPTAPPAKSPGLRSPLRCRIDQAPAERPPDALGLGTGAGHDAGILANAGIPSAMIFVRNPTGVSHSPAEFAERDDCLVGVEALADVLRALSGDAV